MENARLTTRIPGDVPYLTASDLSDFWLLLKFVKEGSSKSWTANEVYRERIKREETDGTTRAIYQGMGDLTLQLMGQCQCRTDETFDDGTPILKYDPSKMKHLVETSKMHLAYRKELIRGTQPVYKETLYKTTTSSSVSSALDISSKMMAASSSSASMKAGGGSNNALKTGGGGGGGGGGFNALEKKHQRLMMASGNASGRHYATHSTESTVSKTKGPAPAGGGGSSAMAMGTVSDLTKRQLDIKNKVKERLTSRTTYDNQASKMPAIKSLNRGA